MKKHLHLKLRSHFLFYQIEFILRGRLSDFLGFSDDKFSLGGGDIVD